MTSRARIVIRRPPTLVIPVCWSGRPGWFGPIYTAKFTDGTWRRVSRSQIEAVAYD